MMDNHTSLRAESERSGVNFTESLVDWPPTLVSTLKGCLGIVALVGVVAEVLTLRRITLFLGSISGHQVKSATARQHDDDLKRHPQLLFSFSICDMLQCGLCAPLVIFRKLSDFDMAWSWSDAIFRTIGSSHLLVIIFKVRQNLSRTLSQAEKPAVPPLIEMNSSDEYRKRQSIENSKFEGVLEVFVLWLVGIFVISMVFMLCQALKYFASFENSDRVLLLGVLLLAHFTPLVLLSFHGFQLRKLRHKTLNISLEGRTSSVLRRSNQQTSYRHPSQMSEDSSTLVTSPIGVGRNKTNFSTLSLAGSFSRKQRRSSWNSFRKKSTMKQRNHAAGKMSPKLDRHPSLRYSIKRRRSSSLMDLNSIQKQQQQQQQQEQIKETSKAVPGDIHQQQDLQKEEEIRTSQFLRVSPQRNTRKKSFNRSDSENQEDKPKSKTRRRRMRISSRASASSGNESGKSSRSSSRSDRSSSSGRLERHPSLKFSTRKKIPLSHEVMNVWKRQMSDDECGKTTTGKKRRKYFPGMGSHEILHKSFKVISARTSERNLFGGSMRMGKGMTGNFEGKKISKKLSPRYTFMSRSHSQADQKKLSDLDRHPSLRFSAQRISAKEGINRQLLVDAENKLGNISKNLSIPRSSTRKSMSVNIRTSSQKLDLPLSRNADMHRNRRDRGRLPLSQSHSYSTLRPSDAKLGRAHSCRGSFVRGTRENSSMRMPNSKQIDLHRNEIMYSPGEAAVVKNITEVEPCHQDVKEILPCVHSVVFLKEGNASLPPLEGVILTTLLLNLPIAVFFLLVLFIFNPSEISEMLLAHKMFSVCISYATTAVRSCIIFRSVT